MMRIEPISMIKAPLALTEAAKPPAVANEGESFQQFFTNALGEVNKLQLNSQNLSVKMAAGEIQDLSEVTIAAEKANVALQLTMQIRNKALDAYQEVMRMTV
nr:flagellar hook-basal body complex protein FliE [uncultured Anaeromusa sp.]